MTIREKLEKIALEKNTACVTISLNTHRTHPDNKQDVIVLKNLLSEAKLRLNKEFEKRSVSLLMDKIDALGSEIDANVNLDSLHIYLSNDTQEIIRSSWPINENGVHISDTFSVRPLIKMYNRSEAYFILLLSQSGVHLYEALNDDITNEIKNEDFPFTENRYYNTHSDKGSDSKHLDDLVREFLNKVDKAVVKMHQLSGLNCIVVCTGDNYSRLMQIADKPTVYQGQVDIDYNNTAKHQIAGQAWEIVKVLQQKRRSEAILEMKEAVAQNKVLTDLQEIYQAVIDGRGDLLIVHENFSQAVSMKDDRTFEVINDALQPNAIDDISSSIAWEVLSKKGRVVFTGQEEIKDLGEIVLKTRY